ncbi:MAG: tetratricopeptide repeat protein [Hyphomicrobiaceae bacterium]
MPLIGAMHLLIAIALGAHAMKTGRPNYWLFILLTLPVVGSIAYVVIELMPEWANSRRARRAVGDIRTIIDPDREFRQRKEAAQLVDSAGAKLALAEECERKGMWADALQLYRGVAHGAYSDDEQVLLGLARAHIELGDLTAADAALERFQAAHPNAHRGRGHLLFARLREAQGNAAEAAKAYEAVARYFVGMEARTRWGLFLLKHGDLKRSQALFQEVVKAAAARNVVLTDEDKAWVKVARANV